jgi:predicted phosphohydrolase
MKKLTEFFEKYEIKTITPVFNSFVEAEGKAVCGSRGWMVDNSEQNKKIILREAGRVEASIKSAVDSGLEPIVFLHYPPVFDDRECEELYSVLTEYRIKRCFFGHVHGDTTGRYDNFTRDGIKFSLISGDRLKFCPKLIEKA